jgi:hypothetical protein
MRGSAVLSLTRKKHDLVTPALDGSVSYFSGGKTFPPGVYRIRWAGGVLIYPGQALWCLASRDQPLDGTFWGWGWYFGVNGAPSQLNTSAYLGRSTAAAAQQLAIDNAGTYSITTDITLQSSGTVGVGFVFSSSGGTRAPWGSPCFEMLGRVGRLAAQGITNPAYSYTDRLSFSFDYDGPMPSASVTPSLITIKLLNGTTVPLTLDEQNTDVGFRVSGPVGLGGVPATYSMPPDAVQFQDGSYLNGPQSGTYG